MAPTYIYAVLLQGNGIRGQKGWISWPREGTIKLDTGDTMLLLDMETTTYQCLH